MDQRTYLEHAENVWRQEYAAHPPKPRQLSLEESREQFSAVATKALVSLARSYGNHVRQQQQLRPLPPGQPKIPEELTNWIKRQVAQVDSSMGSPGAQAYQSIVNSMYRKLHELKDMFLS